ncbi:unnamed protein product [Sympodiomycopsis kandeliae]
MADSGNIKVIVRCRPLNSRERNRGASKLIEVKDQHQLVLNPPSESDSKENAKATKKKAMPFSFDRSYDEDTEQSTLFEYVGLDLLEHSFNGFNTCVFAYGQTGSGKSHSMVGYAEAKGLIPLTCSKLFDDASDKMQADPNLRVTVEVSYIEIYNEKVRDLLNPKNKGNLKVREHPSLGPYVEDLSKLVVSSFADVESLMDEGNKARTVAATNMNETSSRSHAVFTLVLTQKRKDEQTGLEAEKVSRISLVDLAGSERANSTGATGSRLKEGANINRSLTSLGKVIAALATASMEGPKTPKKKSAAAAEHVPYRDSVLTWLLKDSLGGNSKTAMIAAISPADYEETLSTLRYADQAKKIKNKAVVNEDPNAKLIRELKEELEMLRNRVSGGVGGVGGVLSGGQGEDSWDPSVPPEKQVVRYQTKTGEIKTVTKAELQEQMEQSEKIMSSLNESWEDKLQKTQLIQVEREKALEELGITIDKGNVGVRTPKNLPHLVNLNEDALMNECLLYQLKPGKTIVGNVDSPANVQIRLSGSKILPEHCTFENDNGVVQLHAMPDSMILVNGKRVMPDQPRRLRSGYRVILGDFHVFRVNNPSEVRKARDRVKSALAASNGEVGDVSQTDSPARPDSPASDDDQDVDWTYARREAIVNRLNGQDVAFDTLSSEDLDKLFEDISRVRSRKAGGTGNGQSRPESRMSSFMDDSESTSSMARPYSLSTYTDDTSIDPWSQAGGSDKGSAILANGSNGTPASGDAGASKSTPDSIDGDLTTTETELLRARIKKYEERFSRIDPNGLFDEPPPLTPQQQALALKALKRWRTKTGVSMAEDILSNAALLKEANVISRELSKRTTYQFTIVDAAPLSNPTSTIEAIAGLTEYEDVADSDLTTGPKPCVAAKVIDELHNSVYIWSLAKLEQRLQKMRNLYTFIDRPEYSQHFNWADPFYENPAPSYTFLGAALVPLLPLTQRESAKYRLPIVSPMSDSQVGSCSVEVKFVSLSAPPPSASKANGSGSKTFENTTLSVGHKLGIQISVDDVKDVPFDQVSSAHIQLRLGSIAGSSIEKDDSFASVPTTSPSEPLKLRKTVAIILTEEVIKHLQTGLASVEFHVRAKPALIERMLEQDHVRLAGSSRKVASPVQKADGDHERPELVRQPQSQGRLAETELINEQRHDILASVQVSELDASGDYQPVQVRSISGLDPGVFTLRQGLQRKVVLRLSHDSGKQLNWSRVTKLSIGHIRLLDGKGRVHDSTKADAITLNIPLKQQTLNFHSNGTSDLSCWAWWDSSVHDCIFLNRITSNDQRVLLRLDFEVEVDSCLSPPKFSMDIAVGVKSRDAKPPGRLLSMIESATSTTKTLNKTTAVFAVRLSPPQALKSKELWRLDTAAKYVRGQELLGSWKPFGIDYIKEHQQFLKGQTLFSETEGLRVMLRHKKISNEGIVKDESTLLARAVGLWTAATRDGQGRQLVDLPGESEAREEAPSTSPPASSTPLPPPKLTSRVTLVPRTETSTKKGYLQLPSSNNTEIWHKRWFVLKRPHLYIYTNHAEVDEEMVIHLSGVRVEYDENIEMLLGKMGVFNLYTASNSYVLQAQNEVERERWIRCLNGVPLRE